MNNGKRYHVSGTDEHGDIHTFSTDAHQLAEEIMGVMSEDLEGVTLVDAQVAGVD